MLDDGIFQPSCSGVFHNVWPTSDATWHQQDELLELLQFHQPMEDFLEGQDRVFYDQLPDVIQIYRGCSRDRLHGLSWTTDRRIAESFARGHRGVPVPEPVVARVSIPKSAVLAISIERGESECLSIRIAFRPTRWNWRDDTSGSAPQRNAIALNLVVATRHSFQAKARSPILPA
ncbi:hypothetical protein NKH19_27265 [Mesorhizobium sp. M1338]|uniref:hypothetical protein n=1 Tax=unclassified Mesorhizobium TaxID=325217 RepID=UPI00333AF62E